MRPIPAALVTLVLCLPYPAPLFAQSSQSTPSVSVPRLINLSGVYRPTDGQPLAPVEEVTAAIYAEETGGAPLWQETQSVQLDAAGRYSLMLGATESNGVPLDVFASGEARWLGLVWTRPGDVEGPRMQFTSVPYALRATDAETLGGLPASAYMVAPTGNGKAGSRSGKAATSGGTAENSLETTVNPLSVLPGTTNALAKYVNAADVGASAVSEVSGRVGINTGGALPADYLHVRFTDPFGAFTGLAVQNLSNAANASSGMLFYDHNGALSQFQGFNNTNHAYVINNIATSPLGSINFMIGSTSRFFVSGNGNVGISTTAPSANLEVSNALASTTATFITSSTYSNTGNGPEFSGRKARGTFAAPTAVFSGDLLAAFTGRGYGTTAFSTGSRAAINMRAAENWTDTAQGAAIHFMTTPSGTTTQVNRMTLDPFGNLGLGTSGPVAALDMVRETPGPLEIILTRYAGTSDSGEPNVMLRTARGTRAAPSAVQFGDELGGFGATGYGTTGFGQFGAGIGGIAAENWTDTAQGAALLLAATPLGSNEAEADMVILPGGNVGIGTFSDFPTITDKLQVFGDIRMGTSGTNGCLRNFAGTGLIGTCSSDRRYKKDITPFSPVLNQLTALQPVHYFWRAADFPQQHFGDSRAYGLIAQDVEEVLPELVVTGEDGYKAVDYSKLPLLTIQAVKELKSENDALKARLAELERLMTDLLVTVGRQ